MLASIASVASVALLALAALPTTLAAPFGLPKCGLCTDIKPPTLPTNQTAIVYDTSLKTQFVALGVGFQNYSCSAAGTYASAGAVANLYDVSCFTKLPGFDALPHVAMLLGGFAQKSAISANITRTFGAAPTPIGTHFFIRNTDGTISPEFEFHPTGQAASVVVAAKKANIPSPNKVPSVDWLLLTKVSGNTGDKVYRLYTEAGLAPNGTCTPGSPIVTSAYAAIYYVQRAV